MELFKELHDTKKWERMNSIKVMQKQIKELQERGDKLPKEKEADIEKRINELKKMTVERWYE